MTSSVVNVICKSPPSISITNPANNSRFIGSTNINLMASASDAAGTITQVQFFQGSASMGVLTNSPYSLMWSNAPLGSYAFTAVATDSFGLSSTSSVVNVTVAGVAITVPTNNVVLAAPASILLSAAVFDSVTVTQVQYFSGTTNLGTATASPYNFNWTSIGDGVYQLTARATDAGGLVLTSSVVNVISDTNSLTEDRDGDGVPDYIEYLEGRNPLVNGAVPDTNGVVNLLIYTPMK